MKRLMFLLFAVFGSGFLSAQAAPVAYAVLQDGVLTFSYGEKPTGDNVYDFPVPAWNETDNAPWKDVRGEITSVVVEESMKEYEVSTYGLIGLFNGCANLTSLVGLGNFNLTKAARMTSMFSGCTSLKTVDLSRWEIPETKTFYAPSAFYGCTGITAIYVSEKLTPTWNASGIFSAMSAKFVGGNGTVWTSGRVNANYAKIDRPDQAGLFTGRTWIDIDFNGGEGDASAVSYDLTTASIAAPQAVELGVPTRDGFEFDGWELPAEQVADGVSASKFTGQVTVPANYLKAFSVAAKWKEKAGPEGTYTISYYCGILHYADKDEEYEYSETEDHALAFTDPIVSVGYTFAGWHDNPECTGEVVTKIAAGTYGDVALYAGETPIGPTTLVWTGAVDNDWTNGRNWSPNKVPSADDDVRIGGVTVRLSPEMACKSFVLTGDVTFDVPVDVNLRLVIGGEGNITKIGAGNLTVSAANTYVGTLTIKEGTVTRNNIQAFGLADNALVITNATLYLGGWSQATRIRHAVTLEEGAVLDASGQAQSNSGLASVTLTGNASVRADTFYATATTICGGKLTLNGHTLSKTGAGNVSINASAWRDVDSGTIHVVEGRFENAWSQTVGNAVTNLLLWLEPGASYFEGENQGMAWGRIRASNSSRFDSLLSNGAYFPVKVGGTISGGATATALYFVNGSVYEPLAAGDCLVVSNSFEVTYQGKFAIDVSGLDLKSVEHGQQLPLLITPTEVPASKVREVRTLKGNRWPVYTKQRADGMYELGVIVRNGGMLLLVR